MARLVISRTEASRLAGAMLASRDGKEIIRYGSYIEASCGVPACLPLALLGDNAIVLALEGVVKVEVER